jgi:voltage-gated potassium channel
MKWREHMRRAVESRRVFPYLAGMTIGLGVLAGFLVTIFDRKDFPTFGTGIWWAIVTLGTVGYGDVVPHTAWGRVIGSVVIVVGVTFIAFLTATVTSYFVAAEDEENRVATRDEIVGTIGELVEVLAGIESRLAAIEAKLDR